MKYLLFAVLAVLLFIPSASATWWNASITYKSTLTQTNNLACPFLAGSKTLTINGTNGLQVWCNCSSAYLYFNNETGRDVYCVNAAEDTLLGTNTVNITFPDTQNAWSQNILFAAHLNDTSIVDSSPRHSNGAITGTPLAQNNGIVGTSINLNGNNQAIYHPTALDVWNTDMTISFWINPSSVIDSAHDSAVRSILDKFDGAGSYYMYVQTDWDVPTRGSFTIDFKTLNPTRRYIMSSVKNNWTGGVWYNVVYVFANNTALSMYVNGVLDSQNTSFRFTKFTNTAEEFIYGLTTSLSEDFAGNFDELIIANESWSAARVYAQYNATLYSNGYSVMGAAQTNGGGPPDSCSCPASGDWNILCSDNCVISSNCAMGNNKVLISGTGKVVFKANVTGYSRLTAMVANCPLYCTGSGCFT